MKAWETKALKDIPFDRDVIKKGTTITLTPGVNMEYAIWLGFGIFDLPIEYIDTESFKIISKS